MTPRFWIQNWRLSIAAGSVLLCFLALGTPEARAENEPKKNPLAIYLNDEQTRFIKFGAWAQIWGRHTELNPGSQLDSGGAIEDSVTDFTIRRLRFSMNMQLTERFMGFLQIGFNNYNSQYHDNVNIDLLDAYVQYKFSDAFSVGAGRSIWTGFSRYAAPPANQTLTIDLVFAALPTMNLTDEFLRHNGAWVKGQVSRLDYRIVVFKPEDVGDRNPGENQSVLTDDGPEDYGVSTYLKWQFFDKESNHMPTTPATYLGKKKILNIGVGYEFRPDATEHLEQGESVFGDLKMWAIDVFADIPLGEEKRTAVTAYAAFFDYDAGPNALRNLGPNNAAKFVDPAQASFNGPGNAYALVGTGQTIYVQAGYLFPQMGQGGQLGRLQAFFDFQSSDFDRLDERMNAWSVGVHWLIRGMDSRLSFGYQDRPVFFSNGTIIEEGERKGMSVIQYQHWFR
jgi:hypothetical protein